MMLPWWVLPLAQSLVLGEAAAGAKLPDGPLIVGYQNWRRCDIAETLSAAAAGVNVFPWFAVNLATREETGAPFVESGPDYECVAKAAAALAEKNLPAVHLISIGGWNAPHPDTSVSGAEWFELWHAWNSALPMPFDGFDWDLEGHNDQDAPSNTFTLEALHVVVDMSVAAKNAGYIVTMAPPQSYFDTKSSEFNLSLLNTYTDWHPEFLYRGRNCYAYLLLAAPAGTFDLVMLQLYESWSPAAQAVQQLGMEEAPYLQQLAADYIRGWEVDFTPPEGAGGTHSTAYRVSGKHLVRLDQSQLLLGFSCTDPSGEGRIHLFDPANVGLARSAAAPELQPRGYFYWNIEDCGSAPAVANSTRSVNLGPEFNKFLHTRPSLRAYSASLFNKFLRARPSLEA